MRHKAATAHLGRSTKARKGLLRNLVDSLVEHGRIKTTVTRAKELRRHVERAVTLARKDTLHARRIFLSRYPNPKTVSTMFSEIAPRFKTRAGGYTRVIKLGVRKGDCAEMAFIEWVDYTLPTQETKEAKKAAPKAKAKKAAAPKKAKAKTAKKAD